jgi:hypothetical protein
MMTAMATAVAIKKFLSNRTRLMIYLERCKIGSLSVGHCIGKCESIGASGSDAITTGVA